MGWFGKFITWISDYVEKIAMGFSLCGFILFLFTMYFTDLLLTARLISSVLLGTGLVGLLVSVFFWIRRHASAKAQQEREMFLSYKGEANEWRVKLTFNNIITVLSELWALGQLLYFSAHPGQNIFPYEYLDFDKNLSILVLKFVEFNYFIMYGLACLVIIGLAIFFGFGMLVHKCATCCNGKKNFKDVELGRIKKDDDIDDDSKNNEKTTETTPWNSFQRFILQITSMFYVGIFTQALTSLACVWDDNGIPHLLRYQEMKCYTGVHGFLATVTVAIALFLFPLNTHLLTIGTQPPIKSENGEVIFIRDAILTFTMAELLCSGLKLFYGQEKYRLLYLCLVCGVYLFLVVFLIYGRVTKRPACNSRGMFYFKLSLTMASFLAVSANIAALEVGPQYADRVVIGLTYVGWPLIAVSFFIYLFVKGRKGSQAFRFHIDMEALLRPKIIGFALAVDNDNARSPSRYARMDTMTLFTPVGTPWHSVILLLSLAGKRVVLATKSGQNGPLYDEATIIPASHITAPIEEGGDINRLIHEVYIRYVRKDLRKFLKTIMGPAKYNEAKVGMTLDQMMSLTYQAFVQNGMDQQLIKLNYPHLANFMLERYCREQPGNILEALGRVLVTVQ